MPREIAGPRCAGRRRKSLLIGGHLDSVPNGGWLDGCLDFLAGLEVLRRFAEEYSGRPPVTVRLVDWADEEGARFGRSLLGSSAFAGTSSIEADRGRTDKDGIRLEDAVARCGFPIDRFPEATLRAEERGRLHRAAHRARAGSRTHAVTAGRGVGNERRGTPRHHFLRTGSALRIDAYGRAPRCAGGRRKAGARNPLHRRQT